MNELISFSLLTALKIMFTCLVTKQAKFKQTAVVLVSVKIRKTKLGKINRRRKENMRWGPEP